MQSTKEMTKAKIPSQHQAVWDQLQTFQFDEPDTPYPFSVRLAKEQKWTHEFALQAIEEYRKFLYLSYGAGHMVTPSKVVDEVWHLHLIYTHSYWEVLCLQILKRPIHHNPGNGSDEDHEKFGAIYQRTLDDYASIFGEPPIDIWGKRKPMCEWKSILSKLPMSKPTKSYVLELFAPVHGE